MQVYKYASMQVCKFAGIGVCKYTRIYGRYMEDWMCTSFQFSLDFMVWSSCPFPTGIVSKTGEFNQAKIK